MSPSFKPRFLVGPATTRALMRIEAIRDSIENLPISPRMLARLRETARMTSTHASTRIEGNRLTREQVTEVLASDQRFPGRERDEAEVKGYYAALAATEGIAKKSRALTEDAIRRLHALVMGGGRTKVRPTPYRDGQNVIRDGRSGAIVYLPPQAKHVPGLMRALVAWLKAPPEKWPTPILAAVAHYQFATIHPYFDGNGRTARLLTTLVLQRGGYALKGLYSLEEYYARDLRGYYEALTIGPSHNYYEGGADADITPWVDYFVTGMLDALQNVRDQASLEASAGGVDRSRTLRHLDPRQRQVLSLFVANQRVTAAAIARGLGLSQRAAASLCRKWVTAGFLKIADFSRKARVYALAPRYERLIVDGEDD